VRLSADARMVLCGVANLVDHHDCKQVADGREEETIQVVLDLVADNVAEDIQDDLTDDEEENAEGDVTERPAVFQCSDNENDLADHVDEEQDGVHDVCDNEDANGVLGVKSSPALERQEVYRATNDEHRERGQPKQPYGKGCAVFVQLETHKAVDQQAGAQRGYEAILGGGEVWICGGTGGSDAGIEHERYDGQEEVDVEEGRNLLAACGVLTNVPVLLCILMRQRTDSGKLGAHMDDHDDGHDHGQDVHEVVRRLEDERIRNLDCPRIALCLYAHAIVDRLVAHQSAQWNRCLFAHILEVAEAHLGGLRLRCTGLRRARGCVRRV
jgi:hypothetical protein